MTPEQYTRARQLLADADDAYSAAPVMDSDNTVRPMLEALRIILAAMRPEPTGPITVAEELDRR